MASRGRRPPAPPPGRDSPSAPSEPSTSGRGGYPRARRTDDPAWVSAFTGIAALVIAAIGVGFTAIQVLGDDPAQSPVGLHSPTPLATATTSSGPASASPPEPSGVATLPRGPLAPGEYVSSVFEPPLSFAVGEGWTVADELPHALQLAFQEPGKNLYIVRFREAMSGEDGLPPFDPVSAGPAEVIGWLETHPVVIDVSPRFDVSYAGPRGVGIEFDVRVPPDVNQGCQVPCVAVFWVDECCSSFDRFGMSDGRYRVAAIGAPGEVFLVIAEASPLVGDFDPFAAAAQTVLATVRFDGP